MMERSERSERTARYVSERVSCWIRDLWEQSSVCSLSPCLSTPSRSSSTLHFCSRSISTLTACVTPGSMCPDGRKSHALHFHERRERSCISFQASALSCCAVSAFLTEAAIVKIGRDGNPSAGTDDMHVVCSTCLFLPLFASLSPRKTLLTFPTAIHFTPHSSSVHPNPNCHGYEISSSF